MAYSEKVVGFKKAYEVKTGHTIGGKRIPTRKELTLTVGWRTAEKLNELKNHVKGCKKTNPQSCSANGCDSYNDVINWLLWNQKSGDER